MSRADFTVSLPGFGTYQMLPSGSVTSSLVPDCAYSSEKTTGVTRRRPKGKFIPPTSYTFEKKEYRRARGSSEVWIQSGSKNRYSGDVGGAPGRFNSLNHFNGAVSETTAMSPMSSSAALVAARQKLKACHVNLGVAFAERKATSTMLGDNARRIVSAVRSLRRGSFRDAARHLGITSNPGRPRGSNWTNHWLQLQYGWKPLLSDVYGAAKALSERDRGDWRVTVKAHRKDEETYTKATTPSGSAYPTGNFDAYKCVAVRKRGVFVRIDALPENDLAMSFTSLGLTNPLLIGWEVVPFSFVVDWALPIGDWLDSLDALAGYSSAWTSTSFWNECSWIETGVSRTDYTTTSWVKNNWVGTKRMVKLSRTVSQGVPLPAFPRIKDPRSLGHMANGLSLLAQAFGR